MSEPNDLAAKVRDVVLRLEALGNTYADDIGTSKAFFRAAREVEDDLLASPQPADAPPDPPASAWRPRELAIKLLEDIPSFLGMTPDPWPSADELAEMRPHTVKLVDDIAALVAVPPPSSPSPAETGEQ